MVCFRERFPPHSAVTQTTSKPTTDNDDRYQRIWAVVAGIPSGSVFNYG